MADAKKKSRRKEVPTKGITDIERQEMFLFWFQHDRNTLSTAKQFNRSRTTVLKMRTDDNWDQRAEDMLTDVHKKLDKKVVAVEVSNVEIATKLRNAQLKALIAKIEKGKYEPTTTELLNTMEFIQKYQTGAPPPTEQLSEQSALILAMLKSMGGETLRAIGDAVAERMKGSNG